MEHYLSLFMKSVFVENLALAFFLGMCTFLAVSKNVKTAMGLGMAVIVIQAITVPVNNLLFQHVLKQGSIVARRGSAVSRLDFLHRRDRGDGANPGNGPGPLRPRAALRLGHFPAA